MSIIDKWRSINENSRFLISYFFWFLTLFGIFYWGKYWDLSNIGKIIDNAIRSQIMDILRVFIDNKIVNNYEIVINPLYRVVITPECNGLIPYFIYLAGVLAYNSKLTTKILWAVIGYIIFFIVNIIRLVIVTTVVSSYGSDKFFLIHDIGGNLLLIVVGLTMFKTFLKVADGNKKY